jgi:hypothetical protein
MAKKLKPHFPNAIGVLFLRWNLYNRVAVSVAYFEEEKMVYMKNSEINMLKLCRSFLPDLDFEFISSYPLAIQTQKTNAEFWDKMAIEQNGLYEFHKVNPIAIKLTRKDFNTLANLYLKS